MLRGAAVGACALAALAFASPRVAAADKPRIADNHFSLDLFQGPILAPISIMGVAGAYSAYAEGISGFVSNAASPGVRDPFSFSNPDWDVSASISIPIPLFQNDDFDDSGSRDQNFTNFIYVTAGALVQVGQLGFGVDGELQRYTLSASDGSASTAVYVGKFHALGALRLLGDQLVVGAGARVVFLTFDVPGPNLTQAGVSPEVGFLIRPDWQPFRVGATFRAPVDGQSFLGAATSVDASGVKRAGDLVLPEKVVEPWELQMGVAVQVGPRPLNPKWIDPDAQDNALKARVEGQKRLRQRAAREELAAIADPVARELRKVEIDAAESRALDADARVLSEGLAALDRERRARYANWPREHLLLLFDVVLTGPVANGVSIQRFLGQNDASTDASAPPNYIGTSGARVSFSPRLGVETEPLPDLVHTRAGSYYEPARYTDRDIGRQHFTFGADLKLFRTSWFGLVRPVYYKLQTSGDFAARYQSVSLGLGVWH
ncbi:MAG TPA: hypothetical protein VGM56_12990 [Byssovorax sp.]|jgi:hypothetical protein